MNLATCSLAGMLLGIVLLTTGAALPSLLPRDWDEEQAAQFAQAGAQLHDLSYGAGHSHDRGRHVAPVAVEPATELAEARRDFEQRRARLEQAQNRGLGLGAALRWAGIALTLLGVVGYVLQRVRGEEES